MRNFIMTMTLDDVDSGTVEWFTGAESFKLAFSFADSSIGTPGNKMTTGNIEDE